MPVRANRGGGMIIGVVMLINKRDEVGKIVPFDVHDEEALAMCVSRVSEDLSKC